MNKENVQQARDAMQRVIDENRIFDMDYWLRKIERTSIEKPFDCGFAGCFLGTCWLDKRVTGFGPKEGGLGNFYDNNVSSLSNFAAWLGLSITSTSRLCTGCVFYCVDHLMHVTPQQVIKKLDELLDGTSSLENVK